MAAATTSKTNFQPNHFIFTCNLSRVARLFEVARAVSAVAEKVSIVAALGFAGATAATAFGVIGTSASLPTLLVGLGASVGAYYLFGLAKRTCDAYAKGYRWVAGKATDLEKNSTELAHFRRDYKVDARIPDHQAAKGIARLEYFLDQQKLLKEASEQELRDDKPENIPRSRKDLMKMFAKMGQSNCLESDLYYAALKTLKVLQQPEVTRKDFADFVERFYVTTHNVTTNPVQDLTKMYSSQTTDVLKANLKDKK